MEEGVILSLHDEHHGSVSGWGIHGAKGHDSVAMLRTIRANKGELFLILLMDSNLMEASFAVETNEVQSAMGVTKVVKGIIAVGNGVFEWAGNGIEGVVVDAKMPDEVGNVMDVFLVGFGGKNDFGTPGASARVNPSLVEEVINVGLHDWFFVDAIVGLAACNGLGCTSIDTKLEAMDRTTNTGGIKAVPIVMDDRGEFSTHCWE